MNIELIKEQFLKFLKENKCESEYFNNNYNQARQKHWVKTFSYLLNNNAINLIDEAFKWSETYSGHSFWGDLNTKWHIIYFDYLSKNKIYYESDDIWYD